MRQLINLTIGIVLGASQLTVAAQAKETDSVYQWGRWAVLSPAAGGVQPFVAARAPGADHNARPGDAGFQPEVLGGGAPPGPPVVVLNPPGNPPPIGDPRDTPPGETPIGPPVVVPGLPGSPPVGDPRDLLRPS